MKVNPLNAKLNPIYHLLALLGTHPIFHVSRIRVKYLPYKQGKALILKNILSIERKLMWVTLHVHTNCNLV